MQPPEHQSTKRQVEPELLDELSATDQRAIRARRDLQRVNAWMGNARILSQTLQSVVRNRLPQSIAEIGGGDGTFLLQVACRLGPEWRGTSARIIDQQDLLTPKTIRAFEAVGWQATAVRADVFQWLESAEPVDVIVANLFLHHFDDRRLAELLRLAAGKSTVLAACEPHRFVYPTLAGGCVVLIGCNAVTRHDAVASVRAGFVGQELSALWPKAGNWRIREGKAGWFSHSFCASRE